MELVGLSVISSLVIVLFFLLIASIHHDFRKLEHTLFIAVENYYHSNLLSMLATKSSRVRVLQVWDFPERASRAVVGGRVETDQSTIKPSGDFPDGT